MTMHAWHIEDREYARHESRRGRRHAFERVDGAATALVVIDMVPFFVEANDYALGIVANIETLATALRAAGGVVAWVVPGGDAPSSVTGEFFGSDVAERYRNSGGSGPLRRRVWPGLEIAEADFVVAKTAPSAFFPGRCDLATRLDAQGVTTVLIAGTVANVCCESSARDASTLGYRVIMVADANAAVRDADLNATLHTIYRSFGDVRTTAEVLGLLHDSQSRR
jgi:nicotinamidase-related amidase